jgi:hypothetical protein
MHQAYMHDAIIAAVANSISRDYYLICKYFRLPEHQLLLHANARVTELVDRTRGPRTFNDTISLATVTVCVVLCLGAGVCGLVDSPSQPPSTGLSGAFPQSISFGRI